MKYIPASKFRTETPREKTHKRLQRAYSDSIRIDDQIRLVLRRKSGKPTNYWSTSVDWPFFLHYAKWSGYPTRSLLRFMHGEINRLPRKVFDRLAFLTGAYPTASRRERKARVKDADDWWNSPKLQEKYPEILDYLVQRFSNRGRLARAKKQWSQHRYDAAAHFHRGPL